MKLPISLLVLAALSQALSVQITKRSEVKTLKAKTTLGNTTEDMPTVAKNSAAKGSGTKQMDNTQTSKRGLLVGNYGERNQEIGSKYEVKGPPGKNVFDKELQKMISEQYPVRQTFSGRLLQIAKISDVLSEHSPSFEAAVARQLSSPVPVYQTIFSEPTSFEVPTPAASQSGYSNPKVDRLRNEGQDEQKLQGVSCKESTAEQANPSLPRYTLKQPRLCFDTHPQSLDSGLARQHEKLPKEVFRLQEVPTKNLPLLYPLYDQLEPFRYPGQGLQSQYSQLHGILKTLPFARDFNKSNEGNRDKDYSSEDNWNVKGVTPKLQIDIPVHKQGYHAHPNGAISFARFTHNLHGSAQHDTAPQPQSETFHQPQPVQYQAQAIPIQLPQQVPLEVMLQSEQQNEATEKQKLYPPSLQGLIEEIEKYQPLYEQQSKFNLFNHQIQQQPRTLNALQQHLLLQEPRQSTNLQTVQFQRVPASTPLSQSLTPEFYLQKASRSPTTQSPRPFSYSGQSENYDLSLGQASTQLNSLPPLKPNYSKYVKPLEPNTTPVVLPTPLNTIPTFTAKVEPVTDQLISSTTIQPDVKGQENPKTQSMQKETEAQSKTPQPLKPEVFHPSLQTVLPAAVQTATYLPFVTNKPQPIFSLYTTTQPTYQSTSRPTPQRHDVVIQRQEIQEIFFEPSRQLSSTPRRRNKPELVFSPEEELHHLRAQQPHYQLFEQLLPFKHEYQDIHSPQQYILHARESQQKLVSANQGKPQQYLIQQHSFPTPHLHPLQQFQQQLLQNQQPELEQSHQQQQGLNQAQQQQELGQAHQQQQQEALEMSQQQVFEQVQQQRLNQAQQQQESEQAHQQQQQALEQAQQVQQQTQESEQAQQQIQESEQAQQYQKNSLEPSNQIQISTLMPPQDTEKQTKTAKIQQQTESQTELQLDSKLQSSTGKPEEPPEHLSELNFQQPYLGPFLTPSVVPQLIARQQLVAQPDHSPLLGVPSYSDVQYFGKFAETLFGNQ